MKSVIPSLVKLVVYTVVVTLATALLVLVIVNGRTGAKTGYRAVFSDASGVTTNDNVKIAGVQVGKVTAVRVVDRGYAEVAFDVDDDVVVPASVTVQIKYENLIGDRFLELSRGGPANPVAERDSSGGSGSEAIAAPAAATTTDALAPGSSIPVERTRPALNLTVLFGGFRPLFEALQPDEVNQFAEEVLQTLQGQGGTVETLLARTASLTTTIADRDRVIGDLVTDLNDVLGTVVDRDQQLSDLVLQLQRFVSGLSADRDDIGDAVSALGDLTQSVTGLLEDARPPLRDDIAALGGLAGNLDRGKGDIDKELKELAPLLGRVNRTGSYGSWFQFFLCDLGGSFTTIGGQRSGITAFQNTTGRCGR